MAWTIRYYSDAVQRGVLSLPKDILADYLRLADLLTEFGADLRMPHSRAMGGGLFELRPRVLLHAGGANDCGFAQLYQKNRRHAATGTGYCAPAHEGGATCLPTLN